MTYLIDSDWLIDATIGRLPALELINDPRVAGFALSVISVVLEHELKLATRNRRHFARIPG